MKFSSSLVSLSMIAISFAIPLSGTGEADLTNVDLKTDIPAEVYQNTDQSKVHESEHPKSLLDFANRLQEFSNKLDSCYVNDSIDLGCFRSTKALILGLADEGKVSNHSKGDKEVMQLWTGGLITYMFPELQKLSEEKCTQLYHFTSDCIYFNFNNYAAAVKIFSKYTETYSNEALSYDLLIPGAKDLFLVGFRSVENQFERLSEVSTTQWSEEAGLNDYKQLFSEAAKIHKETVAILKSKGADV